MQLHEDAAAAVLSKALLVVWELKLSNNFMITRSKRYTTACMSKIIVQLEPLYHRTQPLESLEWFRERLNSMRSVELSVSLGVDPKQSSLAVRGTVNLPHGSGKEVKVLVFTHSPEDALAAGADLRWVGRLNQESHRMVG